MNDSENPKPKLPHYATDRELLAFLEGDQRPAAIQSEIDTVSERLIYNDDSVKLCWNVILVWLETTWKSLLNQRRALRLLQKAHERAIRQRDRIRKMLTAVEYRYARQAEEIRELKLDIAMHKTLEKTSPCPDFFRKVLEERETKSAEQPQPPQQNA